MKAAPPLGLIRRFALVGVIVTGLDVGLFMWLAASVVLAPWLSDLVAVSVATAASWTMHGLVTFPADPSQRWFRDPVRYLSTAIGALILSVTTVTLLVALAEPGSWADLLWIKLLALGIAFSFRVLRYRETMFVDVRSEQSRAPEKGPSAGRLRLTVVVPAFNEADRIAATLSQVIGALGSVMADGGVEVIVVDDGSSDSTADVARVSGATEVIVHESNRGKGAAVRSGMLAASGRTVAFMDADLSYPPSQIISLLERAEEGWDVVVGSRRHLDTRTIVRAGRLRELGGRVINLLSAYVLLGRYRDTQCGLKAFRSEAAVQIFSHTRIDGFAFDIEVFALVERYRLGLREVPVEVVNSERSTVHVVRDALRLIRDLFRIRAFGRSGAYEARSDLHAAN